MANLNSALGENAEAMSIGENATGKMLPGEVESTVDFFKRAVSELSKDRKTEDTYFLSLEEAVFSGNAAPFCAEIINAIEASLDTVCT